MLAFNCNDSYIEGSANSLFNKNYGSMCSIASYDHDLKKIEAKDNSSPWKLDQSNYGSKFWLHWNDDFADSPVLMDHSASTFYGLGFWMPEQYDEEDFSNVAGAESWILNHGLQMSLGFGDPKGHTPRVRFDYRWHNNSHVEDGVSMQLHFPIN
ncbi:hypothetical protein VT25_16360 [Photobacterium leiognathi subsp. mandapamensis]|nr:hypothetical protein VT25_16360 [Photobacterium leiognathi subsp. mandapamensis]